MQKDVLKQKMDIDSLFFTPAGENVSMCLSMRDKSNVCVSHKMSESWKVL